MFRHNLFYMHMMNHDDAFIQLSAMGFDDRQVQVALSYSHGDFEQALEYLLTTTASNNDNNDDDNNNNTTLVQCDISQYSVEHGQSACTCMALIGAVLFLKQQQRKQQREDDHSSVVSITPEFLTSMIHQGLDLYNKLIHNDNHVNEHMSAEQVLSMNVNELDGLVLQGDIRQGIVGQFGFQNLLQTCMDECCLDNNTNGMAVVITKTPETVVVCLSPPTSYILLDSHPRPPLMDSAHAYMFTSLETLVHKLVELFPYAELGSDVPEVMAMMYNSFDMYPLVWKEHG